MLSAIYKRYKDWRSYRATLKSLYSLSEQQLNDVGLTRGIIFDETYEMRRSLISGEISKRLG
jgi:uncharacterized protein YjiS (DUF1127 family)